MKELKMKLKSYKKPPKKRKTGKKERFSLQNI